MKVTCPNCNSKKCIKSGFSLQKKQRYSCKMCSKKFIKKYFYNACLSHINNSIVILIREGVGMRSICRILHISLNTLISRVKKISETINSPILIEGGSYEVDEMRTYIKKKTSLIWIVYALERVSKTVVSYAVGNRTNETLSKVIDKLLLNKSAKIFTDKLKHYKFLIPQSVHKVFPRATNRIERNNLTMRTHLKRLNRKTICFSRSLEMLSAILKIYFWHPACSLNRPF